MTSKTLPLLAATLLLAACEQKPASAPASTPTSTPATASAPAAPSAPVIDKANAVAMVNGQYIPKTALEELEKEIAMRTHGQSFPKEKLVEELVQRELLIQDATQKHLDQTPEFIAHLSEAKKALLSQADLQEMMRTHQVSDEEIQKEYDSKVAAEAGMEFKARHILVKTEAEAKKLIAELDKGGDFGKLADKHSLDGKEAQNGGDLGWFAANQMVEPFAKAVEALENGKYSKEPVQTQFGYHIILREDSRKQTPPPLEAVKEQLSHFLQRQKIQAAVAELRKNAKVEVLLPPEPVKPADAPPAASESSAPPAPASEPVPAAAEPAKPTESAPVSEPTK